MKFKNDLILRAAKGEDIERTPVWLMRQAGRILPQYRTVRGKVKGFKQLVQHPELACEVTIQPVDILDVDAAIIFSDILVVPEAMGLLYEMTEQNGPYFEKTIQTIADIGRLQIVDTDDLQYVSEAIKLTKKELNGRVPLIGFAGAPWTILAYMVEGHGSKTFSKAKKFLYAEPEAAHRLLQKITDSTIAYLKAQIAAGVDMVQLFDSWAGILSPDQYMIFGLPYINKICNALKTSKVFETSEVSIPITIFSKGAYFARKELGKLKCDVVGLDWNMEIEESKQLIGNDKTLQGNLDPCLLYADMNTIKKETIKMLETFGIKRYIANLGHGVYPDTPLDNVKCFVDTVKEYRFNRKLEIVNPKS